MYMQDELFWDGFIILLWNASADCCKGRFMHQEVPYMYMLTDSKRIWIL
jgi:hypothetical protein